MEVSYRDTELKAILIFQDLIIKPFAVAWTCSSNNSGGWGKTINSVQEFGASLGNSVRLSLLKEKKINNKI
jgi:hypothetical protein